MKQLSDLDFEGGARIHGLPAAQADDQPVILQQLAAALLLVQALSARNQAGGYAGLDEARLIDPDSVPPLPIDRILGLAAALADRLTADQAQALVASMLAARRGAPGGLAGLDDDGVLPLAQAGAALITDVDVVDSEAAMLALTHRHNGDVAIRTDISRSFVLKQTPASILANWQEILAPTTGVTSLGGQSGDISAAAARLLLEVLPLAGGTMTGPVTWANGHRAGDGFRTLDGKPFFSNAAGLGLVAHNLCQIYFGAATTTGTAVIKAPAPKINVWHSLRIVGQDHAAPSQLDCTVTFYLYDPGGGAVIYNPVVVHRGAKRPPVRVAFAPDGAAAVLIGASDWVWSYPHLSLVEALFRANDPVPYAYGWTAAHLNELTGYTSVTDNLTVYDPVKYIQDTDARNAIAAYARPPLMIALSDEATAIAAGVRATIRAPQAMVIDAAVSVPRISVNTASSSGGVTVDIKVNGVSIFATRPTIDAGEKSSVTAATPAVLAASTITVPDDAEITFEVTGAGTGARGLKATLYWRRAVP